MVMANLTPFSRPGETDRLLLSLVETHKKQAILSVLRSVKQGTYGCSINAPLLQIWKDHIVLVYLA